MNDFGERTRDEQRYYRRFAVYWLQDIRRLQNELDALGVEYPKVRVRQSKEDYKKALIDLLIANEQRIA